MYRYAAWCEGQAYMPNTYLDARRGEGVRQPLRQGILGPHHHQTHATLHARRRHRLDGHTSTQVNPFCCNKETVSH